LLTELVPIIAYYGLIVNKLNWIKTILVNEKPDRLGEVTKLEAKVHKKLLRQRDFFDSLKRKLEKVGIKPS
jgi:hypothetical protein